MVYLLESILKKKNEGEAYNFAKKINRQVKILADLVNGLLDISKIKAGKLVLDKDKFILGELIKETVEIFKIGTKNKFIVKGDTQKEIYGDKERLELVLSNLLNNAIRYSPKGKKIIIFVKEKRNKVIVGIKDFGIGIEEKNQKQIFSKFFRGGDDVTSSKQGFGIGLYLCQEIIKYHKGKVWFESKRGEGSTFFFSLPIT